MAQFSFVPLATPVPVARACCARVFALPRRRRGDCRRRLFRGIPEGKVSMSKRRVVVTGMGLISPVGNDVATAWERVVKGISGIGPVTHFDTTAYATRIAGQVRDFDPAQWVAAKDVKKMDPFIHYGVAARYPGAARFRAGSDRSERAAHRRGGRRGHWWPAHDRGHHPGTGSQGSAPGVAVLSCPARSSTWCPASCRSCLA